MLRLIPIALLCWGPSLIAQTWNTLEEDLTGSTTNFGRQTHSWADVDGDGDYDLFVGSNKTLWLNDVNASGDFINRSDLLPVMSGGIISAAFGDFNNDGKPDLHLGMNGTANNYLLLNQFPQPFIDVAAANGLDDNEYCQPAFWGDYNNDGFLDIYVTHEFPGDAHEFWQNGPSGFTPRFPTSGGPDSFGLADLNSHAYGLTWSDIDIDGDIDAITSACGSGVGVPGEEPHNKVYENLTINLNGPAEDRFEDRTQTSGIGSPTEAADGSESYWATLFDYDGDAFPDLFIGDATSGGNHRIWRNTGTQPGDFGFELVDPAVHMVQLGRGYGHSAVAGDYDNDGDLDLYLTLLGGPFRNEGNGSFTRFTDLPSTGSGFKDASWVDIDGDGDLDLLNQNDLFENPGFGNHWLSVELEGVPGFGTTKAAHHVRLALTVGGVTQYREHRFMVGTYSQHMLPTHFGLGQATMVDQLQITWPGGDVQIMEQIPADQHITIVQTASCLDDLFPGLPHWFTESPDSPYDIDRNGFINTLDYVGICTF